MIKRRHGRHIPRPLWGVIRVAYPKASYRTSNPLPNHHFGTDNDPPMNFSIWTPPYPPPPVPGYPIFLGGGGEGGPNFLAHCGRCAWTWTRVPKNFFLVHGPPNP